MVRALAAHPLQRLDALALPTAEAVAAVRALRGGLANPVPRRLQQHLDGEVALTAEQVRRHVARMALRLGLTRLELLEELILDELAQGLPVPTARDPHRHTLQMIPWSDGNRRALRRFLKAHWSGDTTYLRDHPVSRAWLARHPELDAARWLEGIELSGPTDTHGTVRIALERDPLEALKLGTYVGSCLGLGGAFSFSAAAVVLDINKQVLYARNDAQQVVARQLVAISTNGKLACFAIYPASAEQALQALFHRYDAQLAEALGLPLHEDNSKIEFVLSTEWWDDGAIEHEPA